MNMRAVVNGQFQRKILHITCTYFKKPYFGRPCKKQLKMKKFLIGMIAFLSVCSAYAQSAADQESARKATQELTAVYGLSEAQVQKMYVIQERRFRNLSEIAALKTTDETLYREKMKSIRNITEGSIAHLLTPEQKPILDRERADRRRSESEKIKELQKNGASKDAIHQALLEMETEY